MAIELARKHWNIEEYDLMIDAGVFLRGERVELLEGEIVDMAPIGLRHEVCVTRLELLFHELLGRSAVVWVQNSVQLSSHSRPQPDLALLRWRADLYSASRPTAADALLLVEVAESSLDYDRGVKAPLYARSGVPILWIVNLRDNVVEVHSNPTSEGYSSIQQLSGPEALSLPPELGGTLPVSSVLS